MVCRFEDLRCKEIINIRTGCKIGFPDDVEFESCTAKIIKLVVYGRSRFFGLFGREDDCIIPWCDIEVMCNKMELCVAKRSIEFKRGMKLKHTQKFKIEVYIDVA